MAIVRNWSMEWKFDGQHPSRRAGPARKDGGIALTIYQRDKRKSVAVVKITGQHTPEGTLLLEVAFPTLPSFASTVCCETIRG